MKYLIGNWKANKNIAETRQWIDTFMSHDLNILKGHVEVVLCPPYPFIPLFADAFADHSHLHVGAQDISQFGAGTYTGEVAAHSLQGMVDFVLIGHSERRKYFSEKDNTVDQKAQNALGAGIEPIIIINDTKAIIPNGVTFVAYEPVESISSGKLIKGQETPVSDILEKKNQLSLPSGAKFIYGASTAPYNVRDYVENPEIDGVLPGAASLNAEDFYTMAERCSHLTTE